MLRAFQGVLIVDVVSATNLRVADVSRERLMMRLTFLVVPPHTPHFPTPHSGHGRL